MIKKYNYRATIDLTEFYERISEALRKSDITLEINQAGLRHPVHESYPGENFLKIALQKDISICISSDSHKVTHFVEQPREETKGMIKKLNKEKKVRYSIFAKKNKKDIYV